jgi:LmbE family N-acetylglucosaminyl deacetylase
MPELRLFDRHAEPSILCLGAHPDDIELGCGGTILRLVGEVPRARFHWVVFSGSQRRAREARQGVGRFLDGAASKIVEIHSFKESYFPFVGGRIKDCFEQLKRKVSPDLVLTHCANDAHQDHQLISRLTWNTFREHLILEYEVPKYDGDLGSPSVYLSLSAPVAQRKIEALWEVFRSQHEKQWFTREVFRSILSIRGVESRSRYAEAFYCRKMIF